MTPSSSPRRLRGFLPLFAVSALTVAACSLGGCSDSEPAVGVSGGTGGTGGKAGSTSGGSAGSTVGGSAGSTSGGSAGSTSGGSAGSTSGGSAGSTAGGSAGSTSGGASGASGKAGAAGSTAGGSAGSTSGGAAGSTSGGAAGSTSGGAAGSTSGGAAGSTSGGAAGTDAGGAAGSAAAGAAGSDAGGAAGSAAAGAAGSDAGGSAGAGGAGLPAPSTYTITGAGFNDASKHTGKIVYVKLQASSGDPIVGSATIVAGGFAIPLLGAQNREYSVEGFIDSAAPADKVCGAEEPVLTPFTVTFDELTEAKSVAPSDFAGNTCPVFPLAFRPDGAVALQVAVDARENPREPWPAGVFCRVCEALASVD